MAGICGPTEQALCEAATAKELGHHIGMISLSAFRDDVGREGNLGVLLEHCRRIAEMISPSTRETTTPLLRIWSPGSRSQQTHPSVRLSRRARRGLPARGPAVARPQRPSAGRNNLRRFDSASLVGCSR